MPTLCIVLAHCLCNTHRSGIYVVPSRRGRNLIVLRAKVRGCVKMQILTHTRRCVRMVKMQGAEDEGAGSVLKYMTKPEDDSNAADWPL